jgi:hypothetical protein
LTVMAPNARHETSLCPRVLFLSGCMERLAN